jgi:YggT family protein
MARLAAALVVVASFVLFARVVASWVDPYRRDSTTRWLTRLTEPVLAPVRRRLPATGRFDLSPLVVVLALGLLLDLLRL